MGKDPEDAATLLEWSAQLLDHPSADTTGFWPRAAAFLARQGIETAMAKLWDAREPTIGHCSIRVQLLCLADFTEPHVAQQVSHAYAALSRACHHHPYELPPTATELRRWISEAQEVAAYALLIT